MTITGIIVLLLLGLLFLVLEVIVLPGTTFLGIAGVAFMLVGVVYSFTNYGNFAGLCTLGGAFIVTLGVISFAFRANTWNRFTLHKELKGKVNVIDEKHLAEGEEGVAYSRLAPMGKAEFKGKFFEVTTNGEFVDPLTKITIVAVSKSQIIVKPKKT